ncbi:MAG TPA: polymer-forming cytoskeletal protein [Longimicrobiales bacterium]|nr:polymer-forming cytoskeletal protein [Longimicrobiales bacterium]
MALLSSREREIPQPEPRMREARGGDVSVISKDVRIKGDVETRGAIRIEGTVNGNVWARSLELATSGTVSGDVGTPEGEGGDALFVIDGTVEGAVRASNVEVRKSGSVLGGVVADHATIRGRVQGGIVARNRLALQETCIVEGDVNARRLALEEGGQVNGNIRIGDRAHVDDPATAKEPAKAERKEAEAAKEPQGAKEPAAKEPGKGSSAKEGDLVSAGGPAGARKTAS